MQLLNHSDNVREELIANQSIYQALQKHFTGEQQLAAYLGGSDHNAHYKIGRLKSGIVLATREPVDPLEVKTNYEYARQCSTAVPFMERVPLTTLTVRGIQGVIQYCEENDKPETTVTTSVAIGVQFRRKDMDNYSYALVVEDLTAGGRIEYNYTISKWDVITPKGKQIKVMFDLPTTCIEPAYEFFDPKRLLVFEPR